MVNLFIDYIGGLGRGFLCCHVMFQLCIQEPFVNIPEDTIREALKVVLGNASTSKLSCFISVLINCYYIFEGYKNILSCLFPMQMQRIIRF
jgi:hypothetical protein